MIPLEVKYKGKRSYLHGSDLFSESSRVLAAKFKPGRIKKLCFKSFARNKCYLQIEERPPADMGQVGNGVWLDTEGISTQFWIVESKLPVNGRRDYEEDKIVKYSQITDNEITLKVSNSFTLIENIVALGKSLNYSMAPKIDGNWVFGQIELVRELPTKFSCLKIKCKGIKKNAFSRHSIYINSIYFGEVRSIVGKP